jgi:hypothetical protein
MPLPLDLELVLAGASAELDAPRAALARLPGRGGEAIVLPDFNGLSCDEVSPATSSSAPAVEPLLRRARSRLHRELRPPVGLLPGLRDALERIVSARSPGGADTALAKAGTVAGVAVAAGRGAVSAVVDRSDSAPTRRQPARPGEVRTEPAPVARRSAGATAPIASPLGGDLGWEAQDAQHRRLRPSRPAGISPARTGGAYGNPDSKVAAAAAAQPPDRAAPRAPAPPHDPRRAHPCRGRERRLDRGRGRATRARAAAARARGAGASRAPGPPEARAARARAARGRAAPVRDGIARARSSATRRS